MKGNGMPVVGMTPVTAITLMNACMQIHEVMPPASRAPNRSGARSEARTPRHARKRNAPSTATVPIRPSSSPMIAKMKSVCASGSHSYFCTELPNPTPKIPPEPKA
jgi:hypothetical protein